MLTMRSFADKTARNWTHFSLVRDLLFLWLPPNRPIANASARHTCGLTGVHGAVAFAIGP